MLTQKKHRGESVSSRKESGDRSDIIGRDEFPYSDTYDKSKLPDLVFSEKYRRFFLGGV
jgi:hypothetical protein